MAEQTYQNLTVYLGSGETRERRLKRARELALKYVGIDRRTGEPAVSALFQEIIDGKLIIIDPDEYRQPEAG